MNTEVAQILDCKVEEILVLSKRLDERTKETLDITKGLKTDLEFLLRSTGSKEGAQGVQVVQDYLSIPPRILLPDLWITFAWN